MAKTVTVLKVFVASPEDVAEDREWLEEVIQELNKLWENSRSIKFDLVRWETDTYPDMGDDGQAVITRQIADNYDIFIGILWKNFGTPTGRAESGGSVTYLL